MRSLDTSDRFDIRARFHVRRGDFELDVNLTLPGRGVTALFGHSGCGKTTCLRALAGLERFPDSYCALGPTVWQDEHQGIFVPTHQRTIGYVFQEASLFTHLSVRHNIEFGQKRARSTARGPSMRLEAVAALLGIDALLQRRPTQLSGGERQRVAIARALLTSPDILLMDEPLAALDFQRKQEILPYLERLHDELSIPIIYVSHSPDEVARLADHLVVLHAGRVVAHGPLMQTLARTDLPPVFADDAGVVLQASVAAHHDEGLTQLLLAGGVRLWVAGRRTEPIGQRLRCRIHARDVSVALHKPVATSILNVFAGTITALAPMDTLGHVLVQLQSGEAVLLARITEHSRRALNLQLGQQVWVQVKAVALV